jgi:uncharacterized membrane protein
MRYTGSYAVVLVLHLLAAVFVVGPLAVAAVTSPRLARAGRLDALQAAQRTTRLYALASIVVVLLGTAMVGLGDTGEAWSMGQLWVSASYALWILAVVLTIGVVVPAQRAAIEALEAGDSAAGTAGRMAVGGGLAMLAWVVIVVLMVTKPGV